MAGVRVGGVFNVDCRGTLQVSDFLERVAKANISSTTKNRLLNLSMKEDKNCRISFGEVKSLVQEDDLNVVRGVFPQKWEERAENLVVNKGLQVILDTVFSSGAQISPWYVGLAATSPSPAAGDVMGSHAGWVEFQAYDEAARQEWTEVRTDQSMDNDAAKATYTIATDGVTIGGAFLVGTSTKGGTTGSLMCVAAFTAGNKSADDGDTLEVKYTFSAADDGA